MPVHHPAFSVALHRATIVIEAAFMYPTLPLLMTILPCVIVGQLQLAKHQARLSMLIIGIEH